MAAKDIQKARGFYGAWGGGKSRSAISISRLATGGLRRPGGGGGGGAGFERGIYFKGRGGGGGAPGRPDYKGQGGGGSGMCTSTLG